MRKLAVETAQLGHAAATRGLDKKSIQNADFITWGGPVWVNRVDSTMSAICPVSE
jgi:hypothetical protein